jgi:hypothetical protein
MTDDHKDNAALDHLNYLFHCKVPVNRPREDCRYCQKRYLGASPFQLVSVEIVQNRNNPAVLYLHNLLETLFPPAPQRVQLPNCDDSSHTIPEVTVPSNPQPSGSRPCSRQKTAIARCFKCAKPGHKADKCPTKPAPDRNRVICFLCSQVGHFCQHCTHPPVWPVEKKSISTRRWNSIPASLSVTSRPSR